MYVLPISLNKLNKKGKKGLLYTTYKAVNNWY
jgi:hypothetical protein